MRNVFYSAAAAALLLLIVGLTPPDWFGLRWQATYYSIFGEAPYRQLSPGRASEAPEPRPFCPEGSEAKWRKAFDIAGVHIQGSFVCNPDNPYAIAAFVKGTNNVSNRILMNTQLAPDTVIKTNDRDGDGDPDDIHIRLEVIELNGSSPDIAEPVPAFFIAPGIQPGLWVFAPKTRGMSTENFESIQANRMLRAPSPAIRVEQGDNVKITLENSHYMPHTIHLHGVDHPFRDEEGEGNDGVPMVSEMMIMPGGSRTYNVTARQPGTMFYHCHVQPQAHVLMGLQGMFVVEENRPNNSVQTFNVGAGQVRQPSVAVREQYVHEYDLHYFEIDRDLNNLIQTSNDPRIISKKIHQDYNVTQRDSEYYLLNGRSFPYTLRESLVVVRPDEKVKLRVLNGGSEGVSLHTHGHKVTITHYDGVQQAPSAQITRDVVWLSAAQRLDLELNTTDDGLHSYGSGVWLMHDHREQAVTTDGINPGGDLSMIVYEEYLNDDGSPRVEGDLSVFFDADYYAGDIATFAHADQQGNFAEPTGRAIRWRLVWLAMVCGLFIGIVYRWRAGRHR